MKVQVINSHYSGTAVKIGADETTRDMPEIEKQTKSAIDKTPMFDMFGGTIYVGDRVYQVVPIID